jgi:DsbC/DsbD-like thiol-disulfide interchange protein
MKLTFALFLTLMPVFSMAQLLDGKPLVTPSLHIGTTDFSQTFTIAVRFQIAPEWHLYWKNPGDAGLAPKAQWTLPEGFSVSDFQFPTPHKIATESAVDYGYDRELVLLATITPPKPPTRNFTSKDFTLKADLTWLVCRESCIPGDATLELNTASLTPKHSPKLTRSSSKRARNYPNHLQKPISPLNQQQQPHKTEKPY